MRGCVCVREGVRGCERVCVCERVVCECGRECVCVSV